MGGMLVAVVGLKGGTGKTTVAVSLAALLRRSGPVGLLDADPQRTASRWLKRAELDVPTFGVADSDDARGDIIEAVSSALESVPLLVGDCRPSSPEVARTLATLADLVLVPTGASGEENYLAERVLAAVAQEERVRGAPIPTLIVPTRWNSRTMLGRESIEHLETLGRTVTPPMHERVAWQEAVSSGVWLDALPRSEDALREAEAVAAAVSSTLGTLTP